MNEFYAVLITLALSAPVFLGGGIFLGYKYGRKAEAKARELQAYGKSVKEAFRNIGGGYTHPEDKSGM